MSTSSNSSPRILTRGEETQFQVSFFADQNLTTPLLPVSPEFPSYSIVDLDGTPIQTGVGTQVSPGKYIATFLVPKDARLSYFNQKPQQYNDKNQGMDLTTDLGRYRIEWQIVTNSNQQVNFVEEFDVRDIVVTQSQNRDLQSLVLAKDPVRLVYRTTTLPTKVNLRFIVRGNEDNPVATATFDQTLPDPLKGDLKHVKDGDSYVFYADIPAGVTCRNTAYMALWQIQETPYSIPTTEWQIIVAISTNLLPLMTHLRMLIDKFQKRAGRLQAYQDSDLLEYLSEGLRMVNLPYPTTGYTMDNIPDGLQGFVLLAAGWWALKAQQILGAELNINFSGQSVTLSVDSAAQIDSAAQNMMDEMNKNLPAAKMAYVRKAGGVGTFAGRSYSYRLQYNYVYKISGGNGSNNLLGIMAKIGLL